MTSLDEPGQYAATLAAAKAAFQAARSRAVLAANSELIGLYWQLGRLILDRQQTDGWGAGVVERLSADLREDFPEMSGFRLATSATCVHSSPHGPATRMCHESWHICPGATTGS